MRLFTVHKATDEQALIKRCLRQEAAAQKELYQRFAAKMMAVCRRYVRRQEEAEEVLSNGFIKVFGNLESYHFKGSFEGWIRTIVVRECLMYLRGRKAFMEYTDKLEEYDNVSDFHAGIHLDAEDLMKLIDGLPTGYRAVFNLYAIEGYKHQEIAELLGITESTSKTQLLRARQMLQQRIKSLENSFTEISNIRS